MDYNIIAPNLLGWVGNIFFIYGVYALGQKNITGFYSAIVGNLLYVFQGLIMNNSSLTVLSIILVFMNIRGIFQWTKMKNESLN